MSNNPPPNRQSIEQSSTSRANLVARTEFIFPVSVYLLRNLISRVREHRKSSFLGLVSWWRYFGLVSGAGRHEVTVIDRQPGPAFETSFTNAGEVSPGYSLAPALPLKALKWMFQAPCAAGDPACALTGSASRGWRGCWRTAPRRPACDQQKPHGAGWPEIQPRLPGRTGVRKPASNTTSACRAPAGPPKAERMDAAGRYRGAARRWRPLRGAGPRRLRRGRAGLPLGRADTSAAVACRATTGDCFKFTKPSGRDGRGGGRTFRWVGIEALETEGGRISAVCAPIAGC